jgi:hypothetical protein
MATVAGASSCYFGFWLLSSISICRTTISKYPQTTGNLKIIYNMWFKLPVPNIGLTKLLVKVEELSLPVRGEQITILGSGESLNVAVDYNVDVDIPLLPREIYTKHFEHKVKYQQK